MHLGNEERLYGINQSTLCLLICHLSFHLFEVVLSCACGLKESFLLAHYFSQWGYHVRSAEDPVALEQHSSFSRLFWFPTKLLYQAQHLGSNKYWSTSKRTKPVHNQFKDSSCICFYVCCLWTSGWTSFSDCVFIFSCPREGCVISTYTDPYFCCATCLEAAHL